MTKTKLRALILTAALTSLATASAAGSHLCYTAEVPETIVLPDGSRHATGTLRICTDRAISPVSILHRFSVGGRPVGMFLSVPRAIEEDVKPGTAQFVFERDADDGLDLVGYAVSARDGTTMYQFSRGTAPKSENIARADEGTRKKLVVLVASAR